MGMEFVDMLERADALKRRRIQKAWEAATDEERQQMAWMAFTHWLFDPGPVGLEREGWDIPPEAA